MSLPLILLLTASLANGAPLAPEGAAPVFEEIKLRPERPEEPDNPECPRVRDHLAGNIRLRREFLGGQCFVAIGPVEDARTTRSYIIGKNTDLTIAQSDGNTMAGRDFYFFPRPANSLDFEEVGGAIVVTLGSRSKGSVYDLTFSSESGQLEKMSMANVRAEEVKAVLSNASFSIKPKPGAPLLILDSGVKKFGTGSQRIGVAPGPFWYMDGVFYGADGGKCRVNSFKLFDYDQDNLNSPDGTLKPLPELGKAVSSVTACKSALDLDLLSDRPR